MARKTGSYNYMFFSEEFSNGDIEKALANYSQIFDEMREDYLSGEPYKLNMSGVYGWCDQTIPVDYGLVFIDIDKKEIHSLQGYDTPAKFGMLEITDYNPENEIKRKFIIQDKIEVIRRDKSKTSVLEFFKANNDDELKENVESVCKLLLENNDKKLMSLCSIDNAREIHSIDFQLKGWTIKDYSEDISGILELFNEVKQYLNEEEIQEWKEYALYKFEEYYDDVMEEMENREASDDEFDAYLESKKEEIMSHFKSEPNPPKP